MKQAVQPETEPAKKEDSVKRLKAYAEALKGYGKDTGKEADNK